MITYAEAENAKHISEAFVISLTAKIYRASRKPGTPTVDEVIRPYRTEWEARVVNPDNRLIFRALLGEEVQLTGAAQRRFDQLTS